MYQALTANDLEYITEQLWTISEYDLEVEASYSESADKDDAIEDGRQALRRARVEIKGAIEAFERAGLKFDA